MRRMVKSHHKTMERERLAIQSAMDATKSPAERNRLGQFATPPNLAADIARFVGRFIFEKTRKIHFADPSIGSGSFFSAAVAAYGLEHIQSAVGVEVDAKFADVARRLWTEIGLKVTCGDFTHLIAEDRCPPAPNLILANPPYVRHHHMDREEKERLQRLTYAKTGVRVNGLAGLYVYFLLLATAWLEEGGCAAWLIPSEFMDVNYGAALKRFLTDRVTLLRAHRFDPGDVQFGDALVSSAVIVFKKTHPPPNHESEFSFGGTVNEPRLIARIGIDRLRDSRKWTAFPTHVVNDRRALEDRGGPTLADFFRIKRGIATGSNKFFVLDRKDAKRRRLPARYLRPILPSPRHLETTVIQADNEGYPQIGRQLCVIDCDLAEHLLEQRYPDLWRYLRTADVQGVREGYLVGKRNPWYRQEQREPAPFLCTYMGRGAHDKQPFRFIYNCSSAIATNLYLMLYPRGRFAEMLRNHPERGAEVHALLADVTGHELRGEGRIYGGGLNKIEPSELGRISAAAFLRRWPELIQDVQPVETGKLFGGF